MRRIKLLILSAGTAATVATLLLLAGAFSKPGPSILDSKELRLLSAGLEKTLSVEELAGVSALVVHGVPKFIRTQRVDLGLRPGMAPDHPLNLPRYALYDRFEFQVLEYMKGSGPDTVTVLTLSSNPEAAVDSQLRIGGESADLRDDQEYILFLRVSQSPLIDGYLIRGPTQGKWEVVGAEAVSGHDPTNKLPIDTLRDRVRSVS